MNKVEWCEAREVVTLFLSNDAIHAEIALRPADAGILNYKGIARPEGYPWSVWSNRARREVISEKYWLSSMVCDAYKG